MCNREEIQEIIKKEVAVVRGDLIAHEGREVQGHQQLEERINDRIDHVIVAIRASHPSVEMVKEVLRNQKNIEEKVDTLRGEINPAIDAIDVAKKIKKGVIWVAGFIIAIAGIVSSITHIRSSLK